MGGCYNICPQIGVRLYTAFREGDLPAARRFQQELIGTWNIFLRGATWGSFDEALRYLGIAQTATAMPYRTALPFSCTR